LLQFLQLLLQDLEDSLYNVLDEVLLDKVLIKELLLDKALQLEELLLLEEILL
jgi:hypothetical protein